MFEITIHLGLERARASRPFPRHQDFYGYGRNRTPRGPLAHGGSTVYRLRTPKGKPPFDREQHFPEGDHRILSMDSDLEAFSHNPAGGSFSPPTVRSDEYTGVLNQRFLSY